MTFRPINTQAPFVDESVFFPDDWKQFLLKITDSYRDAASGINARSIGLYPLNEIITGNLLFNRDNPQRPRSGFRKTFDFGAIDSTAGAGPYPATAFIEHEIQVTDEFESFKIFGSAIDPTATGPTVRKAIPLPYSSATLADNIELYMTESRIYVVVGSNAFAGFTRSNITVEYVKF